MSLAYLTPKGKIIKANGTDVFSPQNAPYSLSNVRLDAEGQLIEFSINNAAANDLENSYIYVDKSHYYAETHKENGITGYLKKSYFIKLKNDATKTYYEINEGDTNSIWFDGHLSSASTGDIFHTEQIICDVDASNHSDINTYIYYKYLKQSFKIKDNSGVEYRDHTTYPQNMDLNEQSPNYNKKELIPTDRLNSEEGNFFKTNINDICLSSISFEAKKSLYKKLTLLCFSIYWVKQEVLDIVAIRPLSEIQTAVNNGTIFSSNAQQQPLFSEIDRVVGQLLIDWGYKNLSSAKKIIPIPSATDEIYNGYYEAFTNYREALDSFYHNLRVKNESGLFPNNDSESRIKVLKDILPSSAWSILPYSFRRNIIDKYIQEDSLKGEAETQCLRIIHSFYLVPAEGEEFLNYLLYKRDGNITNFEKLFHLFDDKTISQVSPVVGFFAREKSNRRSFVYGLYEIWKRTKYDFRYIPPNTTPDSDGVNPNAFFFTPEGLSYYKPDGDKKYFLTLEFSTVDLPPQYAGNSPGIGIKEFVDTAFFVDKNLHNEKVHITRAISHKFNSVNQDGAYLGNGPASYNINEQMYLHLYQPINLLNFKPEEDLKTFLPQDPLVPAFVYYYCNEYDRIKDINAAWSLAIDVTIEVGLFFILGGTSIVKDLRYLGRVTELGKALRNATTAADTVLTFRGAEAGAEIFTLTSGMAWSAANYVQTASNDPATKAAAAKVGFVFFCLSMFGSGATIYGRRQSTSAAYEVLSDTHFNSMPASVKQVVTHLTNADTVALTAFKSKLQQNNHTNIYNALNTMSDYNGIDLQRAFYGEFSKATQAELDILNSNVNSVANWESLFKKTIIDRKVTGILSDQDKVNTIVKYYTQATSTDMRVILEDWNFESRWKFLDKVGVDDVHFQPYKADTELLKGWGSFHTEVNTSAKFGNLSAVEQIDFLSKHAKKIQQFKQEPKLIDHWRSYYTDADTKLKFNNLSATEQIAFLTKQGDNIQQFKQDIVLMDKWKLFNTEVAISFNNLSGTEQIDFILKHSNNIQTFKQSPNLIDGWKLFHAEINTKVKFDNFTAERQIRFVTDHGSNFSRFKNNSELIDYWVKVDDNPLNNLVHSTYIKKVDFLEDVQHTFVAKKKYPNPHPYHPGLEETIGDHISGSPVTVHHNGEDYIIGFTGFHGDYAVTEPNPITLSQATLPGGKKIYPGPLPTVNKDIQTAIIAGTEVPGVGAKDCQVWMWGYVVKKQNGQESLYLDSNNNPIRTWVKKSNSAQTTIFVGMNEDKTLIEVTYARHNLTVKDWVPNGDPNRSSNTWRGFSSEGIKIDICIGPEISTPPTTVPSRTLPYGTVMPQK
ncbi:hypothetical protein [uncultured Chryseobacterium sp.]|uniref:hypothetical protein n=1 Tax=uncultured Chryseobacterium sp. TaxID=259322 RepID=UPI0025EA5747|nr:hypothetical protein [uncultured Chryseobacterium sp.]